MTQHKEHEGDIFTNLSSIKGLADSMTNICEAYDVGEHVQAQIYAYTSGIITLAEKAEKQVSEIEQATHNEKPIIVSGTSKLPHRWDYWQDDVCEIDTLIEAAITLLERESHDGGIAVLNQVVRKTGFLNEHMDSSNKGKTKVEIYAYRNMKVAS